MCSSRGVRESQAEKPRAGRVGAGREDAGRASVSLLWVSAEGTDSWVDMVWTDTCPRRLLWDTHPRFANSWLLPPPHEHPCAL